MSQNIRSSFSSSSSTLIGVCNSPLPPVHHLKGVPTIKKPDLKLDTTSYLGVGVDKQMTGKGFIEPHRNNLPRRKRRVVTAPVDGAATAHRIEKTLSNTLLPTSEEAGPHDSSTEEPYLKNHLHDGAPTTLPMPIQWQRSHASPSSSSVNTNITEPPSSLRASPTPSAPLQKPLSKSSTTFYPTFQINKQRVPFHGHHLDDVTTRSSPPITPTKGHLQPTSATLPRRHRSLVLSVAREQKQRRRSITNQQTTLAAMQSRKPNDDAWKEVGGQRIRQTRMDANTDTDSVNSESQSSRRIQSMCSQELSKGVTLGFLADEDDHDKNIVRIKVYNDLTTPFSSSFISSSSSSSRSSSPMSASLSSSSPSSSSEIHLQLSLPTDLFSYTDGITTLTDSQIQQACTFIDEHVSSILEPSRSVLILAPRLRPEEAMSIGISYLAGMEEIDKGEVKEGSDDDDESYSTVHRLLMAFHDDDGPGSPIPNRGIKPEVVKDLKVDHQVTSDSVQISRFSFSNLALARSTGGDGDDGGGGWRGLRPEWRGVLSFDGMKRLDGVWTPTRRS